LVAILDADKEGFLRSSTALTQTAGRAARNLNGKVIMYADRITDSMQRTIDETSRRRSKQADYNTKFSITPKSIFKSREEIMEQTSIADNKNMKPGYGQSTKLAKVADPIVQYMTKNQLQKAIEKTEQEMVKSAKKMEFLLAAKLRDEVLLMKMLMKEKFGD
jgi:excinuclease ABC subunit B